MSAIGGWIALLASMTGMWVVCVGIGAAFGMIVLVVLNGFSERQAFPLLMVFAGTVCLGTGLISGAVGRWIVKKWLSPAVPAAAPLVLAAGFSLLLFGVSALVLMPSSR